MPGRSSSRAVHRPVGRTHRPGHPTRGREKRPPALEVVEPASRRSSGRGVRILASVGVVLAFAVVFGLVAFHALLAAQQDRLDTMRRELAEATRLHDELRQEVAQLRSPERIVAVATGTLGMVQPSEVRYLEPISEAELRRAPGTR